MHTSSNASAQPLPILIAVILGGMTPSLAAEDKDPQNDKKGSIPEGIVITVLGGTGSRSLAEFRVIAGTPARGVTSEEFRKRTGHDAVAWQPHTLKIGKEGRYVWPLNQLFVSTPGGKNHAGFASFRIEPEDAGDGNATPPIHVLDTIRVK